MVLKKMAACYTRFLDRYLTSPSSWFKDQYSFEKRQSEARRIRNKYQDRIPIVAERAENSELPELDKKKYLVPRDMTIGQFLFVLRKRLRLRPEMSIYLFANGELPPVGAEIHTIDDRHRDEDGFLYLVFDAQKTFGSN